MKKTYLKIVIPVLSIMMITLSVPSAYASSIFADETKYYSNGSLGDDFEEKVSACASGSNSTNLIPFPSDGTALKVSNEDELQKAMRQTGITMAFLTDDIVLTRYSTINGKSNFTIVGTNPDTKKDIKYHSTTTIQ